MLVWATEFPAKLGSSSDALITLAKKWLIGSPHSDWKAEIFKDEPYGEITSYSHSTQEVLIAKVKNETGKWCGLRLKYIDRGVYEWATEIVGHQADSQLNVSIQVHCDLLKPGPVTPKPRKPYIVQLILHDIGGGMDGTLLVSDKPIYLTENDLTQAADIINGSLGNKLPIIYVSATTDGKTVINPIELAKGASGMAHVVVEPSRNFSFKLASNVNRQNAYGGAISIYWPTGAGSQARLLPDRFPSTAAVSVAVSNLVRIALANNRPTATCTWDFICDMISKYKVEALRSSGSKQLEDYISAFDQEIRAKDSLTKKAEEEISRLRVELYRANAAADSARNGILIPGKELPFFSGEIRNVVIKALNKARNQFFDKGRAQNIIDDLIRTNIKSDEEEKIEEGIKSILSSAKDLGRRERRALEHIGFSFNDTGRHIEATYHNDPRYSFTISKTSSDTRGMKNQISDICKTLFQ